MDVTPTPKMLEAMVAFVDATVGEKPHPMDKGPGAIKRREQYEGAMVFLHKMVALSMREGAGRAFRDAGMSTRLNTRVDAANNG